jgi:hypothetical protein
VKTRSGLTSEATERALLGAQAADLRELRLRIALEGALVVLAARRAIGQIDAGRDERHRRAGRAGHRLVRPGDEPPAAVLRLPVTDLRARRPGLPDVGEKLTERLALLGRDHEVACVATEQVLAVEARRALARLVEQQDPAVAIEHADERLGGLGEEPGEGLADRELHGLARLIHCGP